MKVFYIFILCLSLIGCQSNQLVKPDLSLNEDNSASFTIYRPSPDFAGMAIDYRVFSNQEYIGSLGTGEYIQRYIKPGLVTIKVQPYTFGFADGKGVDIDLELQLNKKHYLKFSQTLPGYQKSSETRVAKSGLILTIVNEDIFGERK